MSKKETYNSVLNYLVTKDLSVGDKVYRYCMDNYLNVKEVVKYIYSKLSSIKNIDEFLERLDCTKFKHVNMRKVNDIVNVELKTIWKKYEYPIDYETQFIIEDIVQHSLLEFPIEPDDMLRTIHAIATYVADRDEIDYKHFLNYLLRSKIMQQCNPPMKIINIRCGECAEMLYELDRHSFKKEEEIEDGTID